MRKLIKSILIIFLCFLTINAPANALTPIIITPGVTTISNSLISQNLTLVIPVDSDIKSTVTALDDYITNTSNSNIKVPINSLLLNSDETERPFAKDIPLTVIECNYPTDIRLIRNPIFLLRNFGSLTSPLSNIRKQRK